jgi:hypothetical protein
MPMRRYLDEGAAFTPEAIAKMGEAFTRAASDLGVHSKDETRREAVAQLICELSKAEPQADAKALRDKAFKILSGFRQRAGQPVRRVARRSSASR